MVSRNKNKKSWFFPEEAVAFPVDKDQILKSRVTVRYHQSLRIRVILDGELVAEANKELARFIEH